MVGGYTEVFGGQNISPAQLSFAAFSFAADITFVWPIDAPEGANALARKVHLNPAGAGLSAIMPDALQVSVGQDIYFLNTSAFTVTIKDAMGVTLGTVAPGIAWLYYLTDNTTHGGSWTSIQEGASVSAANAAALAGLGLTAIGSTLNVSHPPSGKNANYTLTPNDRAQTLISGGGAITFSFNGAAVLGNGWFSFIRNEGSGTLVLDPSGAETIDGAATKSLAPSESLIVVSDGASLHTIGFGRSATTSISATNIAAAGTGTMTLGASDIAAQIQNVSGLLTGARRIEYGTGAGYWFVFNNTTGAFATTFAVNGADPGVTIAQGSYGILRSDGTTMSLANSATVGTVTSVGTGTGLTGGPIVGAGTISLANTAVTPGVYGDATHAPVFTVDAQGRLTLASQVLITPAWSSITGLPAAIDAIDGLTPAADKLAYYTGATTAALADFTAYARTLVAAATAAAFRALMTPLTANGDLWTRTGGIDAPLAAGGNNKVLHGTTPLSYAAVDLAADVTGTLPIANGGAGVLGRRWTLRNGPRVAATGMADTLPGTSVNLNLTSQNFASTNVSASFPNGFNADGSPNDLLAVLSANITWTGLSASRPAATPNFLYILWASATSVTTGQTILPPIVQWAGTPSITNGQITFNRSEMKCYLGNGASAPAVNLVLFGEAETSGSAVLTTVAYSYNGIAESPFTATLPAGTVTITFNHNLGVYPLVKDTIIECTTIDNGYAVGDRVSTSNGAMTGTTIGLSQVVRMTRNAMSVTPINGGNQWFIVNAGGTANVALTLASWKWYMFADRGW